MVTGKAQVKNDKALFSQSYFASYLWETKKI